MAYVYSHHRADTGDIFYVGIGANPDGKNARAYDYNKRSKFWKSIVAKSGGFTTVIIAEDIEWEQALAMEIGLIAKYGRSNNNTGVLCNLTDGGEGCKGFVITDEYRRNLSKANKGRAGKFGTDNPFFGKKHTEETRKRLSESLRLTPKNKGINNPNFGKKLSDAQKANISFHAKNRRHTEEAKIKIRAWGKGKPKSEEWKAKVSGENNGWYGKGHLLSGENNPRAKACTYIETGEVFNCLKTACKAKNLSYHTQLAYTKPTHRGFKNRKFNYL